MEEGCVTETGTAVQIHVDCRTEEHGEPPGCFRPQPTSALLLSQATGSHHQSEMHVKESTTLGSTEDVDIKEEAVDEPPSSTSTSGSTASFTAANAITDVCSPSSTATTDSFSLSRDSAVASSEAPLSVSGLTVSQNGISTSDSVNSLQVPLCSSNASVTSEANDHSDVKRLIVSVDSTSTTSAVTNSLKDSSSGANVSDSALETDDSSQDDEMLIAPEDVKLEEVDSDCEDTVDGTILQHLSQQVYKVEPEDSNSSCSLASFSNGFLNGESDASMRKRLFTSLSQSFPGSALSRILHSCDTMPMDSDDEDLVSQDRLSSSCFGEIRLDKGEIEDDELTSLAWLQDTDLLKNMNAGEDDLSPSEEQKENSEGQKNGNSSGGGNFVPQAHPPHVPYNPQKHVNSKPPYSFSCLIFMAVEECPEKKLPVKDIYNWILTHFPYFQNAPTGWKNSVRHNLSLNKCFKKVEKDKGTSIGKGSLWCIDPDYRPNLLQALRKTPYHPYHQLQMMSTMQAQQQIHHVQGMPTSGFRPMPLTQRPVPNTVSPHLFPFLSRRLAQSGIDYFDREMQDVANTLVAMKGFGSKNSSGLSSDGSSDASGPTNAKSSLKRRYSGVFKRQGPFIVTAHPNEDHNYSSVKIREEDAASGTSSIDNEYDFGDEDDDDISEPSDYPSDWDCGSDGDEVDGDLPPAIQRKRLKIDLKRKEDKDKDEEEKQEGAKLLLSLAGISQYGGSEEEEKRSPRKSQSSVSNKTASSSKLTKSASSSSSSTSKGHSSKSSTSSVVSKSTSSLSSVSSGSSSRTHSKSSSRTSSSKSVSKTATPSRSAASSLSSSKSSAGSPSSSKSTPKSSSMSSSKSSSSTSSKSSVMSSLSTKSSVTSSASKASISYSSPSSAKPLNTEAQSQDKSSPSISSSSRKSSIIMTRRGKAAAEAAAAAAAPGVCTRGKKLSSS